MQLARTLPLVLHGGLDALLGWLVYLLMRRHGEVLLEQERLQDRLAGLERMLEAKTAAVPAPTSRLRQSGPLDQPDATTRVLYRPVVLKDGTRFEVAIDPRRLIDPISRGVLAGDFWFLHDFNLLLDLMQPGNVVLDLGGHLGTFSLAAAARGCRVLCIEAAPDNAALLQASVARNGFDRLLVVQAAATDHQGTLQFLPNGPWGTVSNTAVARSPSLIYGREHAPVLVTAVAVDELLRELGWDQVDFIKMDIEGSEVAAIRGMTQLLARPNAPVLLYESNGHALHFFGETPGRLVTSLQRLGYASYLLEPGRLVPIQPGDFQTEGVVNCFAVKGQLPRLEGWRIAAPRTVEDTIERIVSECQHTDAYHRAYIARALAEAEPSILSDSRVARAVGSLCNDPSQDVRAAVAWLLESPPGAYLGSSSARA